jgi:hypothetical protein
MLVEHAVYKKDNIRVVVILSEVIDISLRK